MTIGDRVVWGEGGIVDAKVTDLVTDVWVEIRAGNYVYTVQAERLRPFGGRASRARGARAQCP